MNASRALSSVAVLAAAGLMLASLPTGCSASSARPLSPAREPADTAAVTVTVPTPDEPPETSAPAAKPHRYAVASENATATSIAMSVLERGGSAVDAAIAGLLTVGVTQPVSSGLGGGGFAVVWDAKTKTTTVLDFREVAPRGISPRDYVKRPPPANKLCVMTGVPGEAAGLAEMHSRWGRLAFADLVRDAASVAAKGFPISAHLARALTMNERWLLKSTRYDIFHPTGTLLGAGEMASNPALAATLQRLGAEGKASFYEGAIAADILATARAAGSPMTQSDLSAYKVIERAPLRTTWEGHEIFTMPPPSAGGLLLLETLNMHAKADLTALTYGSGAYWHLLAETFRGAVADRVRLIGDPDFVKADPIALSNPARMKARRARIRMDSTMPAEKYDVSEAGTSHFVAVDADGNVASVTSTVNNMFGAKVVTRGGFVLNDELDDFTTESIERRFGLRRGPNAPRGGARPVSSMTPTIVVKDGAPVLALGGSGGMRIATATTQVLLAHLVFGRSVAQALADPRLETPPAGGLFLDSSTPPDVVQDLQTRGEVVNTTLPNFSAVQAVSIGTRDGVRFMEAAADPRKGGTGAVQ